MKGSEMITDLFPVEQETLSARDFLKLARDNPSVIKQSNIVPGVLGSKSFGAFNVTYTRPIYRTMPKIGGKDGSK
jgi:hypothetical protein